MASPRRKTPQWVFLALALIITLSTFAYVISATTLRVHGSSILGDAYQRDMYLDGCVEWTAVPWQRRLLAPLIRFESFSFQDASGHFADGQLVYAVVRQDSSANALEVAALENGERELIPLIGSRLSSWGLRDAAPHLQNLLHGYFFYRVAYTGAPTSNKYTGPYSFQLVYSVLGVRRTLVSAK